jgi:uncharacterized damage-inducible protein DinB
MDAEIIAAQLIETWQINQRINLYLLDAIAPEALAGISASGGRSVGAQFAHMHSIRLTWIEVAAPELMTTLQKIPTRSKADLAAITHDLLRDSLNASAQGIEIVLRQSLERGRVKGTKLHAPAFLGYALAHEGYHRGEIGIILTQSGYPLPDEIAYGIWDWDKR